MTTPLKHIPADCPDAELSAAVAALQGWELVPFNGTGRWLLDGARVPHRYPPDFATDANAVLPLLEKAGCVREIINSDTGLGTFSGWRVEIFVREGPERHVANDQYLPRAICFALLKSHGWTVLDAAGNGRAK